MEYPRGEGGGVKRALLATYNIFSGPVNILLIGIPENWYVHSNNAPVEVDSYRVVGEYAWVDSGHMIYGLSDGKEMLLGLEVFLDKKERKKDRFKLLSEDKRGRFYVYGHEAEYVLGTFEKGRLSKTSFRALRIRFYCDVSRRWIELYYVGDRIDDLYEDVLDGLTETMCH